MNPFSVNSMINNAEDPHLLDRLASTNLQAKERQKSYMINLLNGVSNLIGGYKSNNIDAIVSKLQEQKISSYSLKLACDKMIDRFDRFPSFREIKSICNECKPIESHEVDNSDSEFDRQKHLAIKKMFLTKGTQEQLDNFTKWWLKENFGLYGKESILQADIKAFEMCALFDWYDSFYRFDMDQIKSICEKKTNILKNERTNAHGISKMTKVELNRSDEWKKFT